MLHRIRYIRKMVTTAIVTVWAVTVVAVVLAAVERPDEYVPQMVSVWNPVAKCVTNATFPSSVDLLLNEKQRSIRLAACCGSRDFVELTVDKNNGLYAYLKGKIYRYQPLANPSIPINFQSHNDRRFQVFGNNNFDEVSLNNLQFNIRNEVANVTVKRLNAPIPSFSACLSDLAPCNFLEGPPAWTIPLKNAKRSYTVSVYVDEPALLYRTRSNRNIKNLSPNWNITVSPTRQTIELSRSANRITYEMDAGRVIIRRPDDADSELTLEQTDGLHLNWKDGSGSQAIAHDGFVQAVCWNKTQFSARANPNEGRFDINGNTIRFQLSESKLNSNLYGLNFTVDVNAGELTGRDAAKFKLQNTAGPMTAWLLKSKNLKIELDQSKSQVRFIRNNVKELHFDGAEGWMRGYGGGVRWPTNERSGGQNDENKDKNQDSDDDYYSASSYEDKNDNDGKNVPDNDRVGQYSRHYIAWCGGESLVAAAENFVAYRIDERTTFAANQDKIRLDFEPATLIITSDGS